MHSGQSRSTASDTFNPAENSDVLVRTGWSRHNDQRASGPYFMNIMVCSSVKTLSQEARKLSWLQNLRRVPIPITGELRVIAIRLPSLSDGAHEIGADESE